MKLEISYNAYFSLESNEMHFAQKMQRRTPWNALESSMTRFHQNIGLLIVRNAGFILKRLRTPREITSQA